MHISFNSKFSTSYELNNCLINSQLSHKDLGVIICTNLQWHHHHDCVLGKHVKCLVLFDIPLVNQIQSLTKLNYVLPLSDHSSPTVQSYDDHI